MNNQKIAIIFDDLIQSGGAENLLLAAHEIWPDAPVYTSVASKKWQQKCKKLGISLQTSFMQRLPFAVRLNRLYSVFLFHIFAFERFDLSEFDVVLSISSRFAHGVITKPTTTHICYMNSPGRMFWEPHNYFEGEHFRNIVFKSLALLFLKLPLSVTRIWDYTAAQRVDHFIANAKTPQSRIRKYYKRNSQIIYPFVAESLSAVTPNLSNNSTEYFLVLSRLLPWKRISIAVRACTQLELPLKVVGSGPDLASLKKAAGSTIEFLGYISTERKQQLLQNCKALIVTQHEDFGIAPLEAMASGKPVIAYKGGGVLETVVPGETGEFFAAQTVESLASVLEDFASVKYSSKMCQQRAKMFNKTRFINELKNFVDSVYS